MNRRPAVLAAADLPRRLVAESLGTALLLATVIGSGIMGERLSGGNVAIALLANAVATGAALVALILTFGPVSGAHFNPAVSVADASQGGLPWREVPAYVLAQVVGAFGGVACAHLMFSEPLFSLSRHVRSGPAQLFSEFVATFGLLAVIWGCSRRTSGAVPFAVGAYITAAYWFTASTSFANPAVTLARAVSDTFAGIRPVDVPGFLIAEVLGAGAATFTFRWLVPDLPASAERVVDRIQRGATMKNVIFACVQSAGRSQMAAAWFNHLANPKLARATSAGTRPAEHVHPVVVDAMKEVGLDLSGAKPQLLTEALIAQASMLVTMGCGEQCPIAPRWVERLDWELQDPKDQSIERVREIRDDIQKKVLGLVQANQWAPLAQTRRES